MESINDGVIEWNEYGILQSEVDNFDSLQDINLDLTPGPELFDQIINETTTLLENE